MMLVVSVYLINKISWYAKWWRRREL